MKTLLPILLFALCFAQISAQNSIPPQTLITIIKAEDERRFDKDLQDLMKSPDAKIRARAILAAGRIGDEKAVPFLTEIIAKERDAKVRAMSAFALGEIESANAADALLKVLEQKGESETRARTVEALGKIAAANPKNVRVELWKKAILDATNFENQRRAESDNSVISSGLTAILRARPENAETIVANFLTYSAPKIKADALNTLARLRVKNDEISAKVRPLLSDENAEVRANAARVLGGAEDSKSFDSLLKMAASDVDQRARVAAIRALANLKNKDAATVLLTRGEKMLSSYKTAKSANPSDKNELLEISTTLGQILKGSNDERAIKFLMAFRGFDKLQSPETEIAAVKISPTFFFDKPQKYETDDNYWRLLSAREQGLGEDAKLETSPQNDEIKAKSAEIIRAFVSDVKMYETSPFKDLYKSVPDSLRAYAAFKTDDLPQILRDNLKANDVIIRATAAELLGELPSNPENIKALQKAFDYARENDKQMNDAQIAILNALVKLDKKAVLTPLINAINSSDYVVRVHAANLVKQNDLTKSIGDLTSRIGTVKNSIFKQEDYARAVSRKSAKAIVTTEKGVFTIELAPQDAPLNVESFIELANKNYFNGIEFHRIVPNFVIQGGDPRGDGNGGPHYQIRCEINEIPYERGAVGMALSGKDTGGSQFFVTHSAQPHLDGGYTVFGKVNETGMKIVDNIARGDKIISVKIVEGDSPRKPLKTVVKAK